MGSSIYPAGKAIQSRISLWKGHRSDRSNVGHVTEPTAAPRVIIRTEGALGRLTLNRPEAINALDHDMIVQVTAALEAWRTDTDVQIVLIDGEGERGMCAGGDVRALHAQIVSGRSEETVEFFRTEYAMNAMIAEYPKPIVAIA